MVSEEHSEGLMRNFLRCLHGFSWKLHGFLECLEEDSREFQECFSEVCFIILLLHGIHCSY